MRDVEGQERTRDDRQEETRVGRKKSIEREVEMSRTLKASPAPAPHAQL